MRGFEVQTFENFDFKLTQLPFITIYESPSDFPNKFVARLFDVDKPTNYYAVADSLEMIRKKMPMHMIRTGRDEADDLPIVETYF